MCFKSQNVLANSGDGRSQFGEDCFGREQEWPVGHKDHVHLCISRCTRVTHDALDNGCPLTDRA
jgi:hypothetical protein